MCALAQFKRGIYICGRVWSLKQRSVIKPNEKSNRGALTAAVVNLVYTISCDNVRAYCLNVRDRLDMDII